MNAIDLTELLEVKATEGDERPVLVLVNDEPHRHRQLRGRADPGHRAPGGDRMIPAPVGNWWLAYDDGAFKTVFLRPVMPSARDTSVSADFVLAPA
jgi:hypothetical protein